MCLSRDALRRETGLPATALDTALDALASGRVNQAAPMRYDSLPMNESRVLYQLIRRATVVTGTGVPPLTADIGIVGQRIVREVKGQRTLLMQTRIEEFGDLRTFGAMEVIDGTGLTASPAFDSKVTAGATITLPTDWSTMKLTNTIGVAQPANLFLLRPQGGGAYKVERVLRAETTE